MRGGKRYVRGLGPLSLVSLKEARHKALELRRALYHGEIPPKRHKAPKAPKVPTFREIAIEWFDLNFADAGEAHRKRVRQSLEKHVYPHIGEKPVNKISRKDVIACLKLLGEKHETLKKVKGRIQGVFEVAITGEYISNNPTQGIDAALPKGNGKTRHFPSVPYPEVGAALRVIQNTEAHPGTKLALEFLVLTATRPGDVRGAVWNEIDLENRVWSIPPERYKTRTGHRVPLSGRAIEILTEAQETRSASGLVFKTIRGKKISDATFSKLLRENGIKGDDGRPAVAHGFRSSFSVWAAENDIDFDLAELCLGHLIGSEVSRAYQRSDLLEKRREILEKWASFIAGN